MKTRNSKDLLRILKLKPFPYTSLLQVNISKLILINRNENFNINSTGIAGKGETPYPFAIFKF